MLTVSPLVGLFEPPPTKSDAGGGGEGFGPLIAGLLGPGVEVPDCTLLPPDGENVPVVAPIEGVDAPPSILIATGIPTQSAPSGTTDTPVPMAICHLPLAPWRFGPRRPPAYAEFGTPPAVDEARRSESPALPLANRAALLTTAGAVMPTVAARPGTARTIAAAPVTNPLPAPPLEMAGASDCQATASSKPVSTDQEEEAPRPDLIAAPNSVAGDAGTFVGVLPPPLPTTGDERPREPRPTVIDSPLNRSTASAVAPRRAPVASFAPNSEVVPTISRAAPVVATATVEETESPASLPNATSVGSAAPSLSPALRRLATAPLPDASVLSPSLSPALDGPGVPVLHATLSPRAGVGSTSRATAARDVAAAPMPIEQPRPSVDVLPQEQPAVRSHPPTATPISERAPPTILPALQAFGAAIRRALVDERKPVRTDSMEDPLVVGVTLNTAPAPAQPIAPSTTLDTADHRWPHAMAEQIERLRDAANEQSTRIRLLPDALGPVDVSVRRDGEQVHVRFTAAQAETRQLLADAQPRLADAAEARGLKLGRTDVSGGELPNDRGAGDHQQQRTPAHAPPPSRPAPARSRADAVADSDTRLA